MKKLLFLALIVALLAGTTTVLAGPPAGAPRGRPKGASSDGPPEWAPRGPPEWASASSPKGASNGPPDKGKGGLNGPAGNGRGAGKAPFYDSEDYECDEGASDTGGSTYGFVIMNTNAEGDLIVQVSLKGATPDATYDIWVNQYPGDCPTSMIDSLSLSTNVKGNGNAHVKVPRVEDAENFWVSAVSGEQVLRSTAVKLD